MLLCVVFNMEMDLDADVRLHSEYTEMHVKENVNSV